MAIAGIGSRDKLNGINSAMAMGELNPGNAPTSTPINTAIKIRIKLFSHIKYELGKEEITIEFDQGATTDDVEMKIRLLGGDKIKSLPFRLAVNQEFISSPRTLSENDEIAVIPPVQGG